MPQRAATFARRPSGTRAAERARSMGEPAGIPVALDLQPLLAPYKRHRGLSIRIERLLHGARLTRGRNNGDRSWSLFPDDLEGLEYIPATAAYEAHTLAIRIISLEGGDGETLSVVDLPVPGVAPVPTALADSPAQGASHAAELAQLHEELGRAKSLLEARDAELSQMAASLAAREAEFDEAHRHADQVEHERGNVQSELAVARQAWERELQQRLSAAEAESKAALERAQADWRAEQGSRLIRSEAESHRSIEDVRRHARQDREAWEQELQQRLSAAEAESSAALEKARAEWQAEQGSRLVRSEADAHRSLEDVRRRAQEELDSALRQARSDWKATEAVRFAAAEAIWRDEASKTAADLRNRAEATEKTLAETNSALNAARSTETDELRRLREQLAQSHADLATRGAELAEARAAAEFARKATRDSNEKLRKAEQEWKIAEARMATTETQSKERWAKAEAETSARLEAAESALVEARAQAEARSHQVSIAQAALKARDSELEQLRNASEQTRLQLSSEADAAARRQRELEAGLSATQEEWKTAEAARLAAAEAQWKADETARFAAAEAQWKAQLEAASVGNTKEVHDAQGALVHAHVELQMLRDTSHREIRQLRDDLSAAQILLSARESELASVQVTGEQARATADQLSETVALEIEKAREKWKLETDIALATAEASWHAAEAPRIAEAAAKLQADAAGGFAEITGKLRSAEATLADSKACAEALRKELTAAQTSLSHREFELTEARELFEQERERLTQAPISRTPDHKPRWEVDEEERRTQFRRRLIRDLAIVSCLAGLAFVAYPRVQPVVADAWPRGVSLQNRVQPWLQMAGLAKLPPPPPVVEPHALVDVRSANLRTKPVSGAHVVMRLARNMEVTAVQHSGKWVFVRVGDGANQQQGWMLNSSLKDQEVAASTMPPHD